MRRRGRALAAGLAIALAAAAPASAERWSFRHDGVLGTSLDLAVEARDAAVAGAAEEAVLREIDRLAALTSTHDASSEIARWLAAGEARRVSPDLAAVLRACDVWRERGGGAFHPGVALATAAWQRAEREGRPPSDAELGSIASRLEAAPWSWDGDMVTPAALPVTVDALAKGFIVDAAVAAALSIDGVRGARLNIGGDLAARGAIEEVVEIAGADPLRVRIADAALATSGAGRRGFRIGDRLLCHVIDPRTACPVEGVRLASVIAPRAADADALATILCVLSPTDGIRLVEGVPEASCRIVDADGRVHASRDWPRAQRRAMPVAARQDGAADAPWNGGFELAVELEIVRAGGGRRYRRPYVAVWVEDADGFPVKTLLLWVQAQAPGPRWIPDLKRWTKADRLRKLAEGTDLVATVSEPTRMPGSHGVVWDGRDNAGAPLPPGDYTLCVEAAREHGSYRFARQAVSFGTEPFTAELPPGDEIGAVRLDYRRRDDADGG